MNFATRAKLARCFELGLVFVLGCGLGSNFFLLPGFGVGTLPAGGKIRSLLTPDPKLELPALNASACTKSKRLGNENDGGWDVCLDDLPATGCVVYSGGINDNPSFDEAISAQPFGCEVHGFDPTLGTNLPAMSQRFRKAGMHLHDWGLGGTDYVYPAGTAPWVWPGRQYGAVSNPAAWQFYALQTAMAELGHEKLAVFKCDIEGGEWPLLERLLSDSRARTMLREGRIRQIMFEVHFLPRAGWGWGGHSERHPKSSALVDAFNLHARDLLHQILQYLRGWGSCSGRATRMETRRFSETCRTSARATSSTLSGGARLLRFTTRRSSAVAALRIHSLLTCVQPVCNRA